MLEKELKYYNEHLEEWLKSQSGKIVVIKDEELLGFFDTFDFALTEGTRRFGLSSYLVRRVMPLQDEIKIPALTIGVLHANPTYTIRS